MEKRNRDRMTLAVFCRVAPVSNRRKSSWKRIENISGAGLLLEWSKGEADAPTPQVGDTFSVELQLPLHPVFGQRVLQYKAKVVRVSRNSSGKVMAGMQSVQTRFKSLRPGGWQQTGNQATIN